jgi:photosystem II stability/assembly factor-like uncharacterized protein
VPLAWSASASGEFVIGGTSDSLIASDNHGQSWRDVGSTQDSDGGWSGNGFSGLLGTQVTFDAGRPGTIVLTALDAGNLLESTDNGASWSRPLSSSWDDYDGGYDVQAGGAGGNVIYSVLGQAGVFNGIAVSRDGGTTWAVSTGGALPARWSYGGGQGSVSIASPDASVAYAVLPDGGFYKTTDTGADWTRVSLASPASAVATSRDDVTTYVSTQTGIYSIQDAAGTAPTPLAGSPDNIMKLAIAADGSVFAVGPTGVSGGGLYTDESGSWRQLVNSWYVSDVAIDPTDPDHIVYVSNDDPYHATSLATGVWSSCDGGQTFTQDNAGLPMERVLSVAFDPSRPEHVVIGTNGRGFWQTQLTACA